MVAGDYVARELECLADDGRLVIIAVQGGTKSEIDAGLVLRRRLDDHRLDAAAAPGGVQGARSRRRCASTVWPLLEAGHDQAGDPPACSRPREAAQAHALMESNQHIGKIVLHVVSAGA